VLALDIHNHTFLRSPSSRESPHLLSYLLLLRRLLLLLFLLHCTIESFHPGHHGYILGFPWFCSLRFLRRTIKPPLRPITPYRATPYSYNVSQENRHCLQDCDRIYTHLEPLNSNHATIKGSAYYSCRSSRYVKFFFC
jgi:hypothetical protein